MKTNLRSVGPKKRRAKRWPLSVDASFFLEFSLVLSFVQAKESTPYN